MSYKGLWVISIQKNRPAEQMVAVSGLIVRNRVYKGLALIMKKHKAFTKSTCRKHRHG